MELGRRDIMLAGLGLGVGLVAGPRPGAAEETEVPQAFSTFGVVPGGGDIDQTATLQEAADAAAQSGTPLFLPAGVYSTSRLGAEVRHPNSGRAGQIGVALSRRRRRARHRPSQGGAPRRPGARRHRKPARPRRRAACGHRRGASCDLELPVHRLERGWRGASARVRADQRLLVRRHPQGGSSQHRREGARARPQSCA